MITKEDAKSMQFEINMIKLAEQRMTVKMNINGKLGDSMKLHAALADLNQAAHKIETESNVS